MRNFNLIIIFLCSIILFINLYFLFGESSVGVGFMWLYLLYPTVIICGFFLALTLFVGIVGKELLKPLTLINIVIICLTGTAPFWVT